MLRAIGGLFAASLVAPYLASFFITLFLAIFDHVSRNGALVAQPSPVDELLGVANSPALGTLGLAIFGLPILLAAAILALALDIFGLRSKRHSVIGGSGLGCLFLGLLFSGAGYRSRLDCSPGPSAAGSIGVSLCIVQHRPQVGPMRKSGSQVVMPERRGRDCAGSCFS